ncbi:MAG TPA: HlyC/CorC family transporter, partial [Anaerolineae bacterium]|nr:HlyC/CorC family transporter [Anaerolineae bacterium]
MDVESSLEGIILLLALLAMGFAAMAEIALASISRSRVRQLLETEVTRAQAADTVLGTPSDLLITLLLTKTFAAVVVSGTAVLLARQVRPDIWGLVIALAFSALVLALLQLISKSLALRISEDKALWFVIPVRMLVVLLKPIVAPIRWLEEVLCDRDTLLIEQGVFLSEEGLRFLLSVGGEEGLIEEEEKEMIASIFEFGETLVREVMVPRIDIVALEVGTSLNEALNVIVEAGHSRIPVYQDTIDNIIGVLYAKDLLTCFRDGRSEVTIEQLLRPPYFVPESKPVSELLHELQQRKVHIAIVVDEYGGTAGLVTIEDLVEEIVGEIQDEY